MDFAEAFFFTIVRVSQTSAIISQDSQIAEACNVSIDSSPRAFQKTQAFQHPCDVID